MFVLIFVVLRFFTAFISVYSQFDEFYDRNIHTRSLKDYASDNARLLPLNHVWNKLANTHYDMANANARYGVGGSLLHDDHQQHVRSIVIAKQVPFPYKIESDKKIPYIIKVPLEKSYPIVMPKSYPVSFENPIYYTLYPIEKQIPMPAKIPVEKQLPYYAHKPFSLYKEKNAVENHISYPVKIPYDRPYALHIPMEKKNPYNIEKQVPYPIYITQDKPFPVPVEKPFSLQYEQLVPYPVGKAIPFPIPIPVKIPIAIPYPVHFAKHDPMFIPVHENAVESYNNEGPGQSFTLTSFGFPTTVSLSNPNLENGGTTPDLINDFTSSTTDIGLTDSNFEATAQIQQIQNADLDQVNKPIVVADPSPSSTPSSSALPDTYAENKSKK